MDVKEAFNTALGFEKKGYKIYSDISKRTKNKIVARTFKYLAEQEQMHIKEIQEYIKKKSISLKGDLPYDTKKFFSLKILDFKTATELSDSDIKAHAIALHLEKDSYNYYREEHRKAQKPELKEFFSFLMKQENAHYDLIQKSYDYIRDPSSFYTHDEKWLFEG